MYLGQMTCDITFGDKYRIRGVNGIEIKKSVHQLIQTAKVLLPLSVVMKSSDLKMERIKIIDKIKEGDTISIAFGYNGNNLTEFTGYIRKINPKQPLEIECEDEMYLMRKLFLKKSFPKNDVKDVLQYLSDEVYKMFKIRFKLHDDIPQVTVKNFLIKGANGLAVLQELSDKYLLNSYLVTINGEKVLYCGLTYGLQLQRVKHVLNKNTISIDDLKFQPNDQTYKIEIRHIPLDGKEIKYEFGDKNGIALIPVRVQGNKTKAELQHIADAEFEKYKTSGYKGSFETFLIPYVEPGFIDDLTDEQFKDRSGSYYIGTVTTTFNTSGGRRKPEIDIRVR